MKGVGRFEILCPLVHASRTMGTPNRPRPKTEWRYLKDKRAKKRKGKTDSMLRSALVLVALLLLFCPIAHGQDHPLQSLHDSIISKLQEKRVSAQNAGRVLAIELVQRRILAFIAGRYGTGTAKRLVSLVRTDFDNHVQERTNVLINLSAKLSAKNPRREELIRDNKEFIEYAQESGHGFFNHLQAELSSLEQGAGK